METGRLDPRLRIIQRADVKDKTVLVRVDHKKGHIEDPYRIDATFPTLYHLASRGAKPILMTHIGRPRDKKTGRIICRQDESVAPIVRYLEKRLGISILVPQPPVDEEKGILDPEPYLQEAVAALKGGEVGMVYLPNTRWFQGEEAKDRQRDALAKTLAGLADLYVNDAFGSWQAHVSTYDVAKKVPAYAGLLLQQELQALHEIFTAEPPFVAVVAGAKYDTKIGPLKALYDRVDHLILGGILYNTYLCSKYGVTIAGVDEYDKALAQEMVEKDAKYGKILEPPLVVGVPEIDGRDEAQREILSLEALRDRTPPPYVVDVAPECFEKGPVKDAILSAKTLFVNAVMGLMPSYPEGSRALYELVSQNDSARKLMAGGDTLAELRALSPGAYLKGLDNPSTYYFTGGGAVLSAIQRGSPYGLKPVEALIENARP